MKAHEYIEMLKDFINEMVKPVEEPAPAFVPVADEAERYADFIGEMLK